MSRLRTRILSALAGLAALGLHAGPPALYVAMPPIGDDTTGDGSPGAPFATIQHAYDMAADDYLINIAAGTYTESVDMATAPKSNLTISGAGADKTIVQAATTPGTATDRVFNVDCTNPTFTDMTIRYGMGNGSGGGGLLLLGSALHTLMRVSVESNQAIGAGNGGGICLLSGTLDMSDCSVIANSTAAGNGGGIYLPGDAELINCTISGNTSGNDAGGIGVVSASLLDLYNSTVANNAAIGNGGGIYVLDDGVCFAELFSSIVATNTAGGLGPDVYTPGGIGGFGDDFSLIGNNQGSDLTAGAPNINDSYIGTNASPMNAGLLDLADNGGPTRTHAITFFSPGLDRGNNMLLLFYDQRGAGYDREYNMDPDMGAYELQTLTVTFLAGANGMIDGSTTLTELVFPPGDPALPHTAEPDPGYIFVGWTGDYVGMDNPLTLANVIKHMTVNANFAEAAPLTLAAEPTEGTTVPAPGTMTVAVGYPVPILAVPNPGYAFTNWSVTTGNASLSDANAISTTVTVDDAGGATVTANFVEETTLTLAVNPGAGGVTFPPVGPYLVPVGLPNPIGALPNPGYEFTGWTVTAGNATLGDANAITTTVTINDNLGATVTANFAQITILSLAVDPPAAGNTMPPAGPLTVLVGAATPIGAMANPGFVFVAWSVTAGNATLGDADAVTTTVTVDDAGGATVTANFVPLVQLTMATSDIVAGSTLPAPGVLTVPQGLPVDIGAMANPGYIFLNWEASPNASLNNAMAVTTTATLSGDATVTATFAKIVHLTMTAVPNGSTTPAPGVYTLAEGTPQAILATPDTGYHFIEWLASIDASLDNASAASTDVTLNADAAVTPVFAINEYTVIFQTDGTPGATVNGAATVTYTVNHGADSPAVTAVAPAGLVFTGWSGDATGMDNPLTLTNVTADRTVTANFGKMVAQGLVFEVNADDVDGLPTPGLFMLKPKVYAVYTDPVKLAAGKKASVKVLTKIVKGVGENILDCEWTKKIKLYSSKDFKAAQKLGTDAATWLGNADNQSPLDLDLRLSGKEAADQSVYATSLPAPEILTVTLGVGGDLGTILIIEGKWFGTKKPKLWREYTVPAKGPAIKQQKYKVLCPTDPALIDSKGKLAFMNRLTGTSKVVVVVPTKDPKGSTLNGVLVLENGVGMATGIDPTVGP